MMMVMMMKAAMSMTTTRITVELTLAQISLHTVSHRLGRLPGISEYEGKVYCLTDFTPWMELIQMQGVGF